MTLGEIFEKHSVKEISNKTNISEENIERLKAEDFSKMVKAKALGFISILERDYNADLTPTREKAQAYYDKTFGSEQSISVTAPKAEEKKGRSKLFPLVILGLLAYASWYFITQFDKKTLATMIPFGENNTEESLSTYNKEKLKDNDALSIRNTLKTIKVDATSTKTNINVVTTKPKKTIQPTTAHKVVSVNRNTHTLMRDKKIILLPAKKLWFGIVDMDTGKRDHFTVTKQHNIDVSKKSWLIATSKAEFAFINGRRTQEFNDAQSHYFKVSREGIEELSKREYVSQGGYKKW